ncbi:MAG: cytochrome b/b6 domain-containing protein [Pseudomonadota bacterium]
MGYSRIQIILHWAVAVLVLAMAAGGLAYSFDLADKSILRGHQSAGQILIVLLALRIAIRLKRGAPPAPAEHAVWERRLASTVHGLLYLCLIVFVASGYVSASALSDNLLLFPVDLGFARSDTGEIILEVHYRLKWVLLALFALHFAGAMKHAFVDRDATLSRMSFARKSDEPQA